MNFYNTHSYFVHIFAIMHKENIFETITKMFSLCKITNIYLLSFQSFLFSIFSLFNLFCFNLFSLQSTFFQSIFFSIYAVSIYSLFNLLSFQSFLFSLTVRNNKILTTSNTGKMTPAKIPIFRFSDAISETNPTKVGPPEHPASPASASSANNAVPPFLREADALLNVPGHMIPTDNPQIEQPISAINGDADSDIVR